MINHVISITFLLLFYVVTTHAITPRTVLANGASMEVHDYHCVCKKLSNSTGVSVLVPWKTSGEWSSYYNSSAVAGLTKNSCAGVTPGHPPISGLPDLTAVGVCSLSTGIITLSNIQNSGGYTLNIYIPSLISMGCQATAYVNNGGGNTAYILVDGNNAIPVCENSELQMTFLCPTGPTNNIEVYRSDMGLLDDFTVDFTSGAGSCI